MPRAVLVLRFLAAACASLGVLSSATLGACTNGTTPDCAEAGVCGYQQAPPLDGGGVAESAAE